jgi:hypothetical protein
MHILNFCFAIFIPFMNFLRLWDPILDFVPSYFASSEAGFLASLLGAIIFFWAGLLRNNLNTQDGISERQYWVLFGLIFLIIIITKIIYAIPYIWITGSAGFFLGWMAITPGQASSKISISIIAVISVIISIYCIVILSWFAWFNLDPIQYYTKIIEFKKTIIEYLNSTYSYLLG